MDDEQLRAIFDEALKSKLGVEVTTSDPQSFRRRFYAMRAGLRAKGDSSLNPLTCRIMPESKIHLVLQGGKHGKG